MTFQQGKQCIHFLFSRPSPIAFPSGLLQQNVNRVQGEAAAYFCSYYYPPTLCKPRPAFSISYTNTNKATLNKHSLPCMLRHNYTHRQKEKKRCSNALLHIDKLFQALKKQISCSHHKTFISCKLVGGPSAFPGEKYAHLTLS